MLIYHAFNNKISIKNFNFMLIFFKNFNIVLNTLLIFFYFIKIQKTII